MSKIEFSCSHCQHLLNIGVEHAGEQASCPYCSTLTDVPIPAQQSQPQSRMAHVQNTPANQMAKGGSPSRLGDSIWMIVIILIVCVVLGGLIAPLGAILGAAAILFFVFYGVGYLVTTVGTNVIHRNDPHYQEYRKSGGQPFLDNLPSLKDWQSGPRNPDYKLPYQEPAYTGFRPPRSWAFQCMTCYARVQHETGQCWNCGIKLSTRKRRFPLDP